MLPALLVEGYRSIAAERLAVEGSNCKAPVGYRSIAAAVVVVVEGRLEAVEGTLVDRAYRSIAVGVVVVATAEEASRSIVEPELELALELEPEPGLVLGPELELAGAGASVVGRSHNP